MRYALAILLFAAIGCRGGILFWGTVYSSKSPDRSAELFVQERGCLADCAVQIVVKRGWHTDRIAWKSDCVIEFAHAEWVGDTVAVFVDGGYCGQIRAAYNTRSRKAVDFKSAEQALRASITKAYRVTSSELEASNGDVFRWATYPGDGQPHRSMVEFRKQFPGP
jgi:hypothetical protein